MARRAVCTWPTCAICPSGQISGAVYPSSPCPALCPPSLKLRRTGERVGGLAQRVRARRGPMTGSGVTRRSIVALVGLRFAIRPYGLSGRIDFFAGGMSPRRAECLNAFWYDGLLRHYERTFSPFHRRVITTDALEVGASGEGDNRDPLFSAFRAVRYPIHEILPIFPSNLELEFLFHSSVSEWRRAVCSPDERYPGFSSSSPTYRSSGLLADRLLSLEELVGRRSN